MPGHSFQIMALPFPWPPISEQRLIQEPTHDGIMHIAGLVDGGILLMITDPQGACTHTFRSQPIELLNPGYLLFEVAWKDNGDCEIWINTRVLLRSVAGGRLIISPKAVSPPSRGRSTDDANASVECAKWVANRKQKFAMPETAKIHRRPRSLDDQADDLSRAVATIRRLALTVRSDSKSAGSLATELRSVIYWQKDDQPDRTHNPLLFRLASKADLPLPVYSRRVDLPLPQIPVAFGNHIEVHVPMLFRLDQAQVVMDVQQWLGSNLITIHGRRPLSVKEGIAEMAHTLGAAHYGEHASELVDELQCMLLSQGDVLGAVMADIGLLVADLGKWVLTSLQSRGVIQSLILY